MQTLTPDAAVLEISADVQASMMPGAKLAPLPCGHFRSVRFAIHDVRFEQCLTCAMVSTVEVPCAVS